MPTRRQFLAASAASALSAALIHRDLFADATATASALPMVTVYKDPGCECCVRWCKHLAANGFVVQPRDVANVDEIKHTMGVPERLQSCHTAVVGRYVVEGHVPADLVKKMLAEQPQIVGLAAPGMPEGSPGMEGAKKDKYEILTFDRAGKTTVFATRGA
jgi:hypothetical protein